MTAASARPVRPPRRYVREPEPLFFPTSSEETGDEDLSETGFHGRFRAYLSQLVIREFGSGAMVCCDQYLYWDAADPGRRLAPDVMVWVGGPDAPVRSWKVWERGAPHVAVEVVSDSDRSARIWERKLSRYRHCGVRELVRFDAEAEAGRVRIWDRVDGDLVERDPSSPEALYCDTLGVYWCVKPDPVLGCVLRLSRDAEGTDLVPTAEEHAAQLLESARAAESAARRGESEARQAESEARRKNEELLAEIDRLRRGTQI